MSEPIYLSPRETLILQCIADLLAAHGSKRLQKRWDDAKPALRGALLDLPPFSVHAASVHTAGAFVHVPKGAP